MTVRAAVSERFVSLDRASSIRMRVEQDLGGHLVVTMRMERWHQGAAADQRTVGAQLGSAAQPAPRAGGGTQQRGPKPGDSTVSGKLERFARELARRAEALEVPQAVEDVFGRYRDDPVGFCRDILGAESATRRSDGRPYQFDILGDLAQHPRVIVKSSDTWVGKSALDAWASLWWLLTRPMSRVVIVAPEFSRQVRTVLFSEMRRWARRSKVALPVSVMASRAVVEGYGDEWAAIGLPATEPDRIEGLHAEAGVLLILDETKGIPRTRNGRTPGRPGRANRRTACSSLPHLVDQRGRSTAPGPRAGTLWARHQVPSTDSSIVSPAWVADRARDWGLGSPLYQARVLGEFPDAGEAALLPPHAVGGRG